MKLVLAIGHVDLRVFLRSKAAYVWLFVVPLVFVYFMGLAVRGPGDPANRRRAVLIDNQDTNFLGRVFLDELGAQGMTLVLLVFAWGAGSLGVLVGSVVNTEDRVIGICVLASVLMAALGGCWWPLGVVPRALRAAALCLPTGWALVALHQLITFGSGLSAVLKPLLVLLGFGAVANLLAARFFRS